MKTGKRRNVSGEVSVCPLMQLQARIASKKWKNNVRGAELQVWKYTEEQDTRV
ncbi:unnamed protein product [Amoebophrya sp. A25]|nr:unnamed protein product [Amoebophrya sp. A25]|eukprot:GSA25T00000113001.1